MERTLLVNGRFPDTGDEPQMVVLCHGDWPPDTIGFAGADQVPNAPEVRQSRPEDTVLDLEGRLLLPGLVDLDIGLDAFNGKRAPTEAYGAYRLAADALYRGITSTGVTGMGPILEALSSLASGHMLWTPGLSQWDPARIPTEYTLFRGAPERGSREEASYLEAVGAAAAAGKKPAVATGKSPRTLVNGLFPLVRAAELLCQGGYSVQDALKAITENNAALLGVSGKTGRLAAGLEGDVVVAPRETAWDITQLQNICMAARGGRLIWSHMPAMDRIRFCVAAPGCE